MATSSSAPGLRLGGAPAGRFTQYLPSLRWLPNYQRQDLPGDLLAAVIVAIMLVPQAMAYALLAGLPPQVGLYASILPLILYGLLGTSPYLGVGPVAIVSLLVASTLGNLAAAESPSYWALALALALLVGLIQLAMGLFRLGFLLNVLSHPVLVGFTGAAALIIAFSQVGHVLGLSIPRSHSLRELVLYVGEHSLGANLVTLGIGLGSIAILLYFRNVLEGQLERRQVPVALRQPILRGAPLVVVLVGTLVVWAFGLRDSAGVKTVGAIPAGLPPFTLLPLDWALWRTLLPTALAISLLGFLESYSVAASLASKRRQKVEPNQELVALGVANLGAAFTGGYPITGSFSRSVVNYGAGARTGLASVFTALLIAVALLFLMPLLYFLPQAVLAAVIIVAVYNLIDIAAFRRIWCYNRADGVSLLVTFVAVLEMGVEAGIVVGIIVSLALYLWRTTRPHVIVVGRVGNTEHYQNVLRHDVHTYEHILALRVEEDLYFANAKHTADIIRRLVAERPAVKHVVLICSATNDIDASALETLEQLIQEFCDAGVTLYLAEVRDALLDRLERVGFVAHLGEGRIFPSAHAAMQALSQRPETAETECEQQQEANVAPASAT